MKSSKSWSKNAAGVAVTMLVVSAFAFSQSDQTLPAKTKTTPKQAGGKSAGSSSAHRKAISHPAKSKTASTHRPSRTGKSSKTSWRRGQQKVDPARAREIQDALIREHYLNGGATGNWDATTEDALRRYQGDHGWQNKTVPDSRALIKLGLGPSHAHLLNPESAMTTAPEPPSHQGGAPLTPSPHTADPVRSSAQPQP
jgi:Putative peptidoglycan binding domain